MDCSRFAKLEYMETDKRAANGRFLAGNPGGGRPRIADDVKALFEAKHVEAVDGLWKLYESTQNEKLKAQILMYWVDRVAGKPAQAITGHDGGPLLGHGLDLSKLSPEQLEQLRSIVRAAR